MDRLNRMVAGASLALVLAVFASGCKSTRPEVPPGRNLGMTGQQPPIGFSSSPGSNALSGLPPAAGTGMPQFGTPGAGAAPYGAPTGNSFGPPGTAGMTSPAADAGSGLLPGATPGALPGLGSEPPATAPGGPAAPVIPGAPPALIPGR